MLPIVKNLQYTKDHEWLKIEADIFWVGVTAYAQDAMGDVVFIELPNKGIHVKQGDIVATVESVKAVSEIYAPLSGEIIEVNSLLTSSPSLINKSPYEDGWILKIKSDNYTSKKKNISDLLDANAYEKFLASL